MSRAIRGRRSLPPRRPEGPLTPEEIERLDEFLLRAGGDIDGFHMLDGFITAIALLPEPLMPAIWHSIIFGGADDDETATRVAAAESAGILGLLLRHWSTVVRRLAGGGDWRIPECDAEDIGEVRWAAGFLDGMYHTEDLREELISTERCAGRLDPIRRVADLPLFVDGQPGAPIPPGEWAELMRELVAGVNWMYRELRAMRRGRH